MRVSVVNFCSTAADMLDFSSRMLVRQAGTTDYDYIIVTWNPSVEVERWIEAYSMCERVDYETNPHLQYVPNLRAMFNCGFDAGFRRNDYVCIVNTDMAFGIDWLRNLAHHAREDVIVNSLHISPVRGANIITANLGIPTESTFDVDGFWSLHAKLFNRKVETERERGGWRATNTMPYIIHRKWWDACGPWETEYGRGEKEPPDRRFFDRCHKAGVRQILIHDSICYHHEAVERRRKERPVGIASMEEGR